MLTSTDSIGSRGVRNRPGIASPPYGGNRESTPPKARTHSSRVPYRQQPESRPRSARWIHHPVAPVVLVVDPRSLDDVVPRPVDSRLIEGKRRADKAKQEDDDEPFQGLSGESKTRRQRRIMVHTAMVTKRTSILSWRPQPPALLQLVRTSLDHVATMSRPLIEARVSAPLLARDGIIGTIPRLGLPPYLLSRPQAPNLPAEKLATGGQSAATTRIRSSSIRSAIMDSIDLR